MPVEREPCRAPFLSLDASSSRGRAGVELRRRRARRERCVESAATRDGVVAARAAGRDRARRGAGRGREEARELRPARGHRHRPRPVASPPLFSLCLLPARARARRRVPLRSDSLWALCAGPFVRVLSAAREARDQEKRAAPGAPPSARGRELSRLTPPTRGREPPRLPLFSCLLSPLSSALGFSASGFSAVPSPPRRFCGSAPPTASSSPLARSPAPAPLAPPRSPRRDLPLPSPRTLSRPPLPGAGNRPRASPPPRGVPRRARSRAAFARLPAPRADRLA